MRHVLLNPRAAGLETGRVELSRELLSAAREAQGPAECDAVESLAGQLHSVDPEAVEGDAARLAFWINVYNALLLHCLCRKPLSGSVLRHLRLFSGIAYRIGDHAYTLNAIEHGVLRRGRRPPLRVRPALRGHDPRLRAAPSRLDPRIHFALNCGARSCPPIRPYDPDTVEELLEAATCAYLEAETEVDRRRGRVRLPRLMRIYRADFGNREAQLRFAARYLPELERWLAGAHRVRVRYGPFDWTVATPRAS